MIEVVEQETTKSSGSSSYNRRKRIQYDCGCKYIFDHHITLEDVCPEHDRELVSLADVAGHKDENSNNKSKERRRIIRIKANKVNTTAIRVLNLYAVMIMVEVALM